MNSPDYKAGYQKGTQDTVRKFKVLLKGVSKEVEQMLLDQEWIDMMREARELGMSPEDVKEWIIKQK